MLYEVIFRIFWFAYIMIIGIDDIDGRSLTISAQVTAVFTIQDDFKGLKKHCLLFDIEFRIVAGT